MVLLLVECVHWKEVKRRRDKDREALFEVDDPPTEERGADLWRSMTGRPDSDAFDLRTARYHKVCIVASEQSPIREWVTFFRDRMPSLVAAEGLHVCTLPFERNRATVVPLEPRSAS